MVMASSQVPLKKITIAFVFIPLRVATHTSVRASLHTSISERSAMIEHVNQCANEIHS